MNSSTADATHQLRRLINGYQLTQALHVFASLGLADLLEDGPRPSDELAAATRSDPPSLYRLLRALAAAGVLVEHDAHRFSLSALGDALRSDASPSLAGWAAFVGRPYTWQAWSNLRHSIRTGENAFRATHGTSVWEYRRQHPEENDIFDHAMTSLTRTVDEAVSEAGDFGRFGTVVDVGGGHAALLARILVRHSQVRGVLFDQPHVVGGAHATLESAGVADRCAVVSGSFFEGVPAGGDAYLMKSIIHDWEDGEALAILRRCRDVLGTGGVVVLVERVLGGPNEDLDTKLLDLLMLVGPGGRERSLAEFSTLFEAAGLRLSRSTPAGSTGWWLIEAAAA